MIVLSNGEPSSSKGARWTTYEERKSVDSIIFLFFWEGFKVAAIACPCNYVFINDDDASREDSLKERPGFAGNLNYFLPDLYLRIFDVIKLEN